MVDEPQPRKRTGGRSARVRDAVLGTAFEIIRATGQRPSIDELAQRTGIQRSSIYRRWGNLDGVVADTIREHFKLNAPIPDTGAFYDDLRAYLEMWVAFHRSDMGRMLVRMQVNAPEAFRRDYWIERYALGTAIFDRAKARNEIPPDVDAHACLELVIAPLYFRSLITTETIDETLIAPLLEVIRTALPRQRDS